VAWLACSSTCSRQGVRDRLEGDVCSDNFTCHRCPFSQSVILGNTYRSAGGALVTKWGESGYLEWMNGDGAVVDGLVLGSSRRWNCWWACEQDPPRLALRLHRLAALHAGYRLNEAYVAPLPPRPSAPPEEAPRRPGAPHALSPGTLRSGMGNWDNWQRHPWQSVMGCSVRHALGD